MPAISITLKVVVSVLILAIGLEARPSDVVYLWRRPLRLLKSLLAMYVVVPVATYFTVSVLDPPDATKRALAVLAICAGAPLLPKKLFKFGGDPVYGFSLVVTTSLLAIVTVPFGVALVNRYVTFESAVTPSQIAAAVFFSFLLPLLCGMAIRAVFPDLADRAAVPILKWAGIALSLVGLTVLISHRQLLLDVGGPTWLALTAFVVISLLAGHALGGPDPGGRTALATACTSRHVALALLVAASYQGPRPLTLVLVYLLVSLLVSVPYLRWRSRVHTSAER